MKNLFIAFEGIDGSGKTTQIKLLERHLISQGHKVVTTFEPTKSAIGTMIRDVFSHKTHLDPKTIAALFVADRLEHLLDPHEGILRLLNDGYTVITDRYYFSSFAYQSEFIDLEWIIQANSVAMELARPDAQIYIDIAPELSLQRIQTGRASTELYETLEKLSMVRNKYLNILERFKQQENIATFEGNQSSETLSTEIMKWIDNLVGKP